MITDTWPYGRIDPHIESYGHIQNYGSTEKTDKKLSSAQGNVPVKIPLSQKKDALFVSHLDSRVGQRMLICSFPVHFFEMVFLGIQDRTHHVS